MEVPGKRIETSEKGNDAKLNAVCMPCHGDNVTAQASGLCKDCEEYMCSACFRQHLRVKSCKHHVLVGEDQPSFPSFRREGRVVNCNKHNGEVIRFYCRKHAVVGCGDCMILEHNTCKSDYIKNMSVNFQQNEAFKILISKIETLISENKENEDKLNEKKQDNKLMLEKALGEIRKFRVDFNKYLDTVEADIVSEAKRIMADNDKLLKKLEQDGKQLSSKIGKVKQALDTEACQEYELFINSVECKPLLSEIEQGIIQVQSKTMKRFKFVCDEQLRRIVVSKQRLGTLEISTTSPRHQVAESTEKHEKGRHDKSNDEKQNNNACSDHNQVQISKQSGNRRRTMYTSSATDHHRTTQPRRDRTSSARRKAVNTAKPKVSELKSAVMVSVEARVRRSLSGWTGTVTAVHPDGRVDVKWDDGLPGGPYTVGVKGQVSLI